MGRGAGAGFSRGSAGGALGCMSGIIALSHPTPAITSTYIHQQNLAFPLDCSTFVRVK
jgi:hypothetical protein